MFRRDGLQPSGRLDGLSPQDELFGAGVEQADQLDDLREDLLGDGSEVEGDVEVGEDRLD